ncbi:hypothetical protein F5Y10DRAFT_214448 [Nemania abortiva]|nr:hypothetical protein F5Y10DRAFT_214448 [Nemania abortiva]
MLDHNTSLGQEDSWELDTPPTQPLSQKKYQCPQCPSSFKRPENLKRHQRGHDEHSRFTCQICDKSFARSDILGRHTAIHNPRERRNDNPQRRRACHECARVRERCSRGEPCRRCAIKALHCLYPDEPQSKITTSDTWNSPTFGPGDYAATTANVFDPQSSLATQYPGRDSLLHVQGGSQWQIEDASVSYGGPSAPPILPQKGLQPYHSSHNGNLIASYPPYNTLSPPGEGLYPAALGGDSINHMKFGTRGAGSDAVLETYYHQTPNMSSKSSSNIDQLGLHQLNPSVEFQGDYIYREPPDTRHFGLPVAPHHNHHSNSGTHSTIFAQPQISNSSIPLGGYEDMNGVEAPGVDFNGHDALSQPLQTSYSRPLDLKAYDFMATSFDEPPQ